ncbi:hypothetical protein CN327_18895 [Bacillus cereus]|nr:hypothetical protein CN327_18895 [Bacillus cereus]
MLKYENKKRMIHREFLNDSLFIFLRISGIINVFYKGRSFSLMLIGALYMPIKLRVGIGVWVVLEPNHAISISEH